MDTNTINNWLKTYLIGPMESVALGDGGRGWRSEFRKELVKRIDKNGNPIYVFDPTLEEQNKVGMPSETLHQKIKGWLVSGHNGLVGDYGSLIWKGKTYLEKTGEGKARLVKILGDIDYVVNSNFIIMRMEKNDSPCGTFGEACVALEHNIPIYVIQTMPKIEYPGSFSQWVYAGGGGFFTSQAELFQFLDQRYNLTLLQ